jgi:hypothetical protein
MKACFGRRLAAHLRRPRLELLEDRRVPSASPPVPSSFFFYDGDSAAFAIDNAGHLDGSGNFVSTPFFIAAGVQTGAAAAGNTVFVRRYDSGQNVVSTVPVASAGVQQGDVAAASDAAGDFIVAWLYGQTVNGVTTEGVEAQRFAAPSNPQDAPTPVGPPIQLLGPGSGFAPSGVSVAMNKDGTFVLTEESVQTASVNGLFTFTDQAEVQAFSASGAPTSAVIPLNTPSLPNGGFALARPAVAMDDAADFVVVWNSAGSVVAQRYNLLSGGYAAGSVVNVTSNSRFSGGQSPTVAMDAAGDFTVATSGGVQYFPVSGPPTTINVPFGYPSQAVGMDAQGDVAVAYIANGGPNGYEINVNVYSPDPPGVALTQSIVQAVPLTSAGFFSPGDLFLTMNGAGSFVVGGDLFFITPQGWSGHLFLASASSPPPGLPSPPPSSPSSPSSPPPSSSFTPLPSPTITAPSSGNVNSSSGSGFLVPDVEPTPAALVPTPFLAPSAAAAAPLPLPANPPEAPAPAAGLAAKPAALAGGGPTGRVGDISGAVFLDRNGNGVRDPNEAGVAGLTVFLDMHGDGVFHPGDPYTVTNAKGEYVFQNLPLNRTYQVRPVRQQYMVQTYPQKDAAHVVQLSDDHPAETDVTFGTVPFRPAAPPVRPAGAPETDSAAPQGKSDGDQSRNDVPPEGRDAAFGEGPFWRPAGLPLALVGFFALRFDRRRRADRRRFAPPT